MIEAVDQNTNKIHEAADVFYHLIMYLEANEIRIEDIMNELDKRKIIYLQFIFIKIINIFSIKLDIYFFPNEP